MEFTRSRTSVHRLLYHFVFVTKYGNHFFNTSEKQDRIKNILNEISERNGYVVNAMEIMDDHIHIILELTPLDTVSNVVKALKGSSARLYFKDYPNDKLLTKNGNLYSPSFFVSTVGSVSKDVVLEYVKNQHNK